MWLHGVIGNEANLTVRKANEQPVADAVGDTLVGSLRDIRDDCAGFVGMLVDRGTIRQHEVSRSPFDFHGTAGTHGCGTGRHLRQDCVVRARDDSATEAPKNKKRKLEMANRDNLAEFHDGVARPPFWIRRNFARTKPSESF